MMLNVHKTIRLIRDGEKRADIFFKYIYLFIFWVGGHNTPVNTVLNVHKTIRLIRDREKREKGVWSVVV